jgi:glutamine amidotransferase
MISVVDYGIGNVMAIEQLYRRIGISCVRAKSAEDVRKAERLILPGVGSFDWAMKKLNEVQLVESIYEQVFSRGASILGICVGMQMLANGSEEGRHEGLGWIPGNVRRLPCLPSAGCRLPQIGWNAVNPRCHSTIFKNIAPGSRFYFLHSFAFFPESPGDVLATAVYGIEYAASVGRGRVIGVQFHPEKSHDAGIALLENFARL